MDTQDHVWIHFIPTTLYPRREKTIWSELELNRGPLASQATALTTRPWLLSSTNFKCYLVESSHEGLAWSHHHNLIWLTYFARHRHRLRILDIERQSRQVVAVDDVVVVAATNRLDSVDVVAADAAARVDASLVSYGGWTISVHFRLRKFQKIITKPFFIKIFAN